MKIGTTNFDGNTKKDWFGLTANEDNLYRVLPPLFSLADKGQYAKYYASHSVWVKDTTKPDSKARPYRFECIQRINKETKMIEQHCPYCDKAREARVQYDAGVEQKMEKEQLKTFLFNQVLPFTAEKKFYINAVNSDNKVGLLPIGIKCFRALQDRLQEARTNFNIDATGMRGLFFNFRKVQKFKGDRDTIYTVDNAQETFNEDGKLMSRFKEHNITEKFVSYLETSARDLGALMKQISADDMVMLINTPEEGKKALADRMFGSSEKSKVEATVPGTNSTVAIEMSANADGMTVSAPQVQAPAPMSNPLEAQPAAAPAPAAANPLQTPQTSAPVAAPVATAAAAPVTAPSGDMSDADFVKTFMS